MSEMKKQIVVNGKEQTYTIDTTQFTEGPKTPRPSASVLTAKMLAIAGAGLLLLVLLVSVMINSFFEPDTENHAHSAQESIPLTALYQEDDQRAYNPTTSDSDISGSDTDIAEETELDNQVN